MNIKPDDKLAYTVDCNVPSNNGRFVEIVSYAGVLDFRQGPSPAWNTKPMLKNKWGHEVPCPDKCLRPIRDQPGNESWFTAAPRSKPATTKQDTINERGELA